MTAVRRPGDQAILNAQRLAKPPAIFCLASANGDRRLYGAGEIK